MKPAPRKQSTALAMPPTSIAKTRANAQSKEGEMTHMEEINDLSDRKRTGSCASCLLF